jgi:hypothetical protein
MVWLEQFNFEKVNCSKLGFACKSQPRGALRQALLAVKRASQAQNALRLKGFAIWRFNYNKLNRHNKLRSFDRIFCYQNLYIPLIVKYPGLLGL